MLTSIASNPLLIAFIVLAIVTVILLAMVISLRAKMNKFLVSLDSDTIADSLKHLATESKGLKEFQVAMEDYLTSVEKRLKNSVQAVHTVRFNPFHGAGGGGNQSFATALLNEHGDGAVISSLYSREHVSVFSKPIKKFTSEHELSTEEKEAVQNARLAMK